MSAARGYHGVNIITNYGLVVPYRVAGAQLGGET